MSTFHEHEHPRTGTGKFAVKEQTEATGVTLACDPSDVSPADQEIPETPEVTEMLWCEACSLAFDESDAQTLYECGTCGSTDAERRCESCNKFKARSETPGCPDCGEPVDENLVQVVHDHDGQVIRAEDYDPDGDSKADRDAAAQAARAEQIAADKATLLAERQVNSASLLAADIRPGAILVDPDSDNAYTGEAEVLSVRHVTTPDGPVVIYKTYDFQPRVVVRRATDFVPTKSNADPVAVTRDGRRITAADFDGARLVNAFDPDMGAVSSPSNGIEVGVGSSTRDGGTIPVVTMMVGHRDRRGEISGMVQYIGRWDDPAQAIAALDEMDRAADALATARAEHPAAARIVEDDAADAADRGPDWRAVTARSERFITTEVMPVVEMTVGISSWETDKGAMLSLRNGRGTNAALTDPALLKAAVAEARQHLDTLTGIPALADVLDDKI